MMFEIVRKWWPVVAFAFAVATIASVSIGTTIPPGPAAERIDLVAR